MYKSSGWIILYLLSVMLAGTVEAKALGTTGILEGRVTDTSTNLPLAGVNVTVRNANYGAATDSTGYYLIGNIRAGVYDVRYSMIGYAVVEMKNVTILPDLRTRIDIELKPATVAMGEIIVEAARPLIQRDLPSTVYSIGGVKLEKLPVSSFRDVLSLQPGTTLEGNVRGGKTTEVIYLIDGLPVQDVIGGGLAMNIPKSSITGLTIHTGGYEAEYGNALSGVVNVVTKSGSDRHMFGVRFDRDSWLPDSWNKQQNKMSELELSAGGPIHRGRSYYYTAHLVNLNDTRWWQDFRHFFVSPVSSEFSGFAKAEHILTRNVKVSLHGIYSFRRWHDYEFSWRFNLTGLPDRRTDSYRTAISLTHTLSRNSFYTFTLSRFYNRSLLNNMRGRSGRPDGYEYDFFLRYIVSGTRDWWADARQIIYTAKLDYTQHIAQSHILKAGFEFNQYNIASDLIKYEPQLTYFGKPILTAPMMNYSNTYTYQPRSGSLYLQDKIELVHDGTSLTLGIRWDFLDPTATRPIVEFVPVSSNEYREQITGYTRAQMRYQISPRIGLAAPVGTNTFFFLNFGHYFQYPLFDLLYSGINPVHVREGVKNVQAGNPDLKPERTVAWEGGFKYGINEDVVLTITLFRKTFSNQIDAKTLVPFDSKAAGDYGFSSYVNNAEARAEGFEILLGREVHERLAGTISYSYMYSEGISEYVDQKINFAQWGFPLVVKPYPLSWDQRHTVKADAEYTFIPGLHGNIVVLYNSPRPYTYYPTRDGFTPSDTTTQFLPNNARMKNVLFLHAKINWQFRLGQQNHYRFNIFADIRNVLNSRNVRWIDSNGRIGGELGDPAAYYDPRRVSVGVRLDF
jgi:outer membrane receptor for ferrienterochelin and colicin